MSKGIAIIYDRASTKNQTDNYTRLDVKHIGKDIAARYGYDTEPEPRFELKSGEDLNNRAVMRGILKDIESARLIDGKPIKAVITPNFTRLSRDEDVVDGLVIRQICKECGVVVIDFNGKVYNFDKEHDQDTALLEFWFASREKRQIISNMLRGLKERATQGKYMGGTAPFGYKIVLSGELNRRGTALHKRIIDPEEAALVREIFQLYLDHSAMETAQILNKQGKYLSIKNLKGTSKRKGQTKRPFTTPDVMRIINNPLYAGWLRWNTGKHYGRSRSKYLKDFEPQIHFDPEHQIISQELFDKAQRAKKQRYDMPARAVFTHYPFSYIMKCLYCGNALNGSFYKSSNQPIFRRHAYRCNTHFDNPKVCPKGQQICAYPVAYAIIPFVAKLIKDKTRLTAALEEAAMAWSNDGSMEKKERETKAELEKTSQGLSRLMDSIADGLLTRDEAKDKIQELRDKKERLMRDLQKLEERTTIRTELLEAMKLINGDLEGALWYMFEHDHRSLARVVRLIFKPHSVAVEGFWDKALPYKSSHPDKRKGRLVSYDLNEPFRDLDNPTADVTSPPVQGGSTSLLKSQQLKRDERSRR